MAKLEYLPRRSRPSKLTSNACLFCQKRKRRCNGGKPCLTCIKYHNTNNCIYKTENDRRKKKYDSIDLDYLEVKADILEQYVIWLSKSAPGMFGKDLKSFLPPPPQLNPINNPADLGALSPACTELTALQEVISTVWKVRNDGGKTVFYGPLSGRQGGKSGDNIEEEEKLDIGTADSAISNDDIISHELKSYLFDLFEQNFANYFFVSLITLNEVKSWCFSPKKPDRYLLLCAIFTYASVYSNDKKSMAQIFLRKAEKVILKACREKLNANVLQALLILSCYEVGMAHDSSGWLLAGMCASQVQFLGLHSKSSSGSDDAFLLQNDPDEMTSSALFWSSMLQDRIAATILGRDCRIQYFRITSPFYTPHSVQAPARPSSTCYDEYISELTFSLHSKMWYIHDRAAQQIYSCKSGYYHNSHRMSLLEKACASLNALHNSLPDEVILKSDTSDKRILLLHLSYYVILLLLHRSYLLESPRKTLALMIKYCNSASEITDRFTELHGFNRAPYFVGYLIFQCAIFDLFVLTHQDDTLHHEANARFIKFMTALSEFTDVWRRGIEDIRTLDHLAVRWNVDLDILDKVREKCDSYTSDNPTPLISDQEIQDTPTDPDIICQEYLNYGNLTTNSRYDIPAHDEQQLPTQEQRHITPLFNSLYYTGTNSYNSTSPSSETSFDYTSLEFLMRPENFEMDFT